MVSNSKNCRTNKEKYEIKHFEKLPLKGAKTYTVRHFKIATIST